MPSRPAALQISLLEPFIVLRSSKDASDGQHERPIATDEAGSYEHLDENCNQIRGLVSINDDRIAAAATHVQVSFRGVCVWVEWIGTVPHNHVRDIISYSVTLPVEATRGTRSIPFSIPAPSTIPPGVDADAGSNRYAVTAMLEGPAPFQSLTAEAGIQIELAKTGYESRSNERVEGLCFDGKVPYIWTADENVGIGAQFAMSLSLGPLAPLNLSIGFLHVLLEERTVSNMSSTSKPVVKRWSLAKLQPSLPYKLLPWKDGKTGCSQTDCALLSAGLAYHQQEQRDSKSIATCAAKVEGDVRKNFGSAVEPWGLSWKLTVPSCSYTAINNTILHPESSVKVTHRLILQIQFKDVNNVGTGIELIRPIQILSSHLAEPGSALPCYYCATYIDHPHDYDQTWRKLAAQESAAPNGAKVLPGWLSRLTGGRRESISKDKESDHHHQHPSDIAPHGSSQMWLDLSSQSSSFNAEVV